MNILHKNIENNLILSNTTNFGTDLGWEESFKDLETEVLKSIINPVENYETVRYINEPYSGVTGDICDIWYFFYFIDSLNGYSKGLDYNLAGISPTENALLLKHTVKSFFRLEFYSTPNRETQKLLFAKNLSIPLGQRVFDKNINDKIFVPVFTGNNYRNTENMYLFWFGDNSVIPGSSFYMTARFFNAEDGSVTQFLNKDLNVNNSGLVDNERLGSYAKPIKFYETAANYTIDPENDLYYRINLRKLNHSYSVFRGIGNDCDFYGGYANTGC